MVLLLAEDNREYYRSVWGFDPITERIDLPSGKFRYRALFPLENDPGLQVTGATIAAEVTFDHDQNSQNHIVFMNQGREARVHCTHTVIYAGSMNDALSLAEDGVLRERSSLGERQRMARMGTAVLPPEEHFVALRSYVAAIAEAGLEHLLGSGSPPAWDHYDLGLSLPFGFNSAMRTQVVAALRDVAPQAMDAILRNVFAELATTAGVDWLKPRINLLDGVYFHALMRDSPHREFIWMAGLSAPFAHFMLSDPAFFELMYEAAPLLGFLRVAVLWKNTPPQVFAFLANTTPSRDWLAPQYVTTEEMVELLGLHAQDWGNRRKSRISEKGYPETVLPLGKPLQTEGDTKAKLLKQANTIGFRAITHPNCPYSALATFAKHPIPKIRGFVAFHHEVDANLLENLASDAEPFVRFAVAASPYTSPSILTRLANDEDFDVRETTSKRQAINEESQ